MENKLIFKDKELKSMENHILGISGENEQEMLVFSFEEGFVNGVCYLELEFPNSQKGFVELEKDVNHKCYKIEVKNSLLMHEGYIKMQLRINAENAVWKSVQFEMFVAEAINAIDKIKDNYPDFINTTNQKLKELDKKANSADVYSKTDTDALLNNKVNEEDGKSLISDAEINRLKDVDNYDDTEVREEITAIKAEQVTQNENIELNTNNIAEIKEENKALRNQIPSGGAEGESITLTDSAGGLEIEDLRIKGNMKQEVREGYNLFDIKNCVAYPSLVKTLNTIVAHSYENDKLIFECNGDNQCRLGILMSLPKGDVTVSWGSVKALNADNVVVSSVISRCCALEEFTLEDGLIKEDVNLKGTIIQNGKTCYGLESNGGEYVIGLMVMGSKIKRLEISDFQVEVGVEARPYEAYGVAPSIEFPSEIERVTGDVTIGVSGKNLIKFAKEDWIGGYFNNDGTINNYDSTRSSLIDSRYYMIPNGFSSVVLSFMPLRDLKIARGGFAFYDKNKNPIGIGGVGANENVLYLKGMRGVLKAKNTIPDNAKYFRFYLKWVRSADNVNINMYEEFYDYISDLQLEVGTEATKYVLYEGQIVAIPLQKEMFDGDYLAEDGEYHLMKRLVLNGTEDWKIANKDTGNENNAQTFVVQKVLDMKMTNFNYVQRNVWCNWFLSGVYRGRDIANGLHYGIECGARSIYVCLEKFDNYTLDEFKAYLAEQYANGRPLEVVYELEEQEIVAYNEEQQEAYEKLRNLKTCKKITYMDSVGDDLKPVLKLKYKQDLETIRENDKKEVQNMNARLDEIEALLSTTATSALLLDNLENDLKSEVM